MRSLGWVLEQAKQPKLLEYPDPLLEMPALGVHLFLYTEIEIEAGTCTSDPGPSCPPGLPSSVLC